MKDCKECAHSLRSYNQYLCRRFPPAMSTSWRRDSRNECGPEARYFDPASGVGPYDYLDDRRDE